MGKRKEAKAKSAGGSRKGGASGGSKRKLAASGGSGHKAAKHGTAHGERDAAVLATAMDPDVTARCARLLEALMAKEGGDVFSHPVDREAYPEYYVMIQQPMDLGTVAQRLAESRYDKLSDLTADVALTFDNCAKFNEATSPICGLAVRLRGAFERLLECWVLSPSPLALAELEDDSCRVCSSAKSESKMVMCEKCDAVYHIFCLVPKLRSMPTVDWYCPRCSGAAQQTAAASKKRRASAQKKPEQSAPTKKASKPKAKKAAIKKAAITAVRDIYFNSGRLSAALDVDSDEESDASDSEEPMLEDLELVDGADAATATVALPDRPMSRLPPKIAAVAVASWDFICMLRKRVLKQPLCQWEEFEDALINPGTAAGSALLCVLHSCLIQTLYQSDDNEAPLEENRVDLTSYSLNAMTWLGVAHRLLADAANIRQYAASDPEPFSGLATACATKEYENFDLLERLALLSGLTQLVVESQTMRQYMDDIIAKDLEMLEQQKKNTIALMKHADKQRKAARETKKQEALVKASAKAGLQAGLQKAVAAVEKAKDGSRKRSIFFMKLPEKHELPDYYEVIKHPMDLSTIKVRLRAGSYKSWAALSADIKLMCDNAREYNQPGSEIYEDADALQNIFTAIVPSKSSAAKHTDSNSKSVAKEETKSQAEQRVTREMEEKYEQDREGLGTVRREMLGRDRYNRPYMMLGEDNSRIFCGEPPTSPINLEYNSDQDTSYQVFIQTEQELDALIASLFADGRRESILRNRLSHIRPKVVEAMNQKLATEAMIAQPTKPSYNTKQAIANRAPDRWVTSETTLLHFQTRATKKLVKAGQEPFECYRRWLAVFTAECDAAEMKRALESGGGTPSNRLAAWQRRHDSNAAAYRMVAWNRLHVSNGAAGDTTQVAKAVDSGDMDVNSSVSFVFLTALELSSRNAAGNQKNNGNDVSNPTEGRDDPTEPKTQNESEPVGSNSSAATKTTDSDCPAAEIMPPGSAQPEAAEESMLKAVEEPTGRVLRLKQEMVAIIEAIPLCGYQTDSSEEKRRNWIFRVLGTNNPAILSDLLAELANTIEPLWLESWWEPWSAPEEQAVMTAEEEQAAVASGYLQPEAIAPPVEVEAPVLPLAWTPEEDAQLRSLVEQRGTGNWFDKAEAFDTERTANALRHRFAQVIAPKMDPATLAALKPKSGDGTLDGAIACAACNGAHKRHTCGKAKSFKGKRKRGKGDAVEKQPGSKKIRPPSQPQPAQEFTLTSAAAVAANEVASKDSSVAAADTMVLPTGEQHGQSAPELGKTATASVPIADGTSNSSVVVSSESTEQPAQIEPKADVSGDASTTDATTAMESDNVELLEIPEDIEIGRNKRKRSQPDRFMPPSDFTQEADNAKREAEGKETEEAKQKEEAGAIDQKKAVVTEEPSSEEPSLPPWESIADEAVTSCSLALLRMWGLDAALKYWYRGRRALRKPEELTEVREKMMRLWESIAAVEDMSQVPESDEDMDEEAQPSTSPKSSPLQYSLDDPQIVAIEESWEGCRVIVTVATSEVGLATQGLVVSQDHGCVRVSVDGEELIRRVRLENVRKIGVPSWVQECHDIDPEVAIVFEGMLAELEIQASMVSELPKPTKKSPRKKKKKKGRRRAEIFMELPTRAELPYYYRVIKRPMDLKMIQQNINSDVYTDIWRFTEDMTLIWNNARTFNAEDSLVYEDATELEKVFNEQLEAEGLRAEQAIVARETDLKLKVGMELEVKWLDKAEKEEWYACTVCKVDALSVDVFYARSASCVEEFEETLLREEITPDRVRPQSRASRMAASRRSSIKLHETARAAQLASAEDRQLDLPAMMVTRIDTPPRVENVASEQHERMLRVWEAVRYLGDGRGRDRALNFCRLPPRRETAYYKLIERPFHLMKVRAKIEKKRYEDMDSFEIDMTTIFDNARRYYKSTDLAFIDAEILQIVFWEALQNIEAGDKYELRQNWTFNELPVYQKRVQTQVPVGVKLEGKAAKVAKPVKVSKTAKPARQAKPKTKKKKSTGGSDDNFFIMEIRVPKTLMSGTICKIVDPHSRVHFVRVPERSEMQQVEGSSDSDAEDTKESAARRIGEQKSGTASVPTNASKYAAAAGAVSQVKPEISTATVKTEVTDGNSSAGDTAEVKTEAVNGGLSSGGAAAATTSEPQIVSSGEHTAESVSKEGDGADATAGTPEKPPPAENKVRMQTVFYRRLPKEYNEEALMLLDREELAQWLTYRNVPFPPAMTLNELRAVAKDKIADPRKLKPKLYRDWGAAWSVEYERWYYINKLTSVTTWEAPSGPATDADGKIRKWAGITLSNPVIPEKKVRHDKSARRDKSTGSGGAQDEHSLAAEEESEGPISINAASLQRLAKALSMDMAEKIVTERKTRLFASSQDAGSRVKALGKMKMAALARRMITFPMAKNKKGPPAVSFEGYLLEHIPGSDDEWPRPTPTFVSGQPAVATTAAIFEEERELGPLTYYKREEPTPMEKEEEAPKPTQEVEKVPRPTEENEENRKEEAAARQADAPP